MKYIYYILAIVLFLSVAVGFELFTNKVPAGREALRVNRKIITVDEFDRLYSACPPYSRDRGDFTNSLITRELLIQEAQKEGIDRDEGFRQSIENYYEQSLIKLLMDRKFASLKAAVTDEEIDRYMRLLKKNVTITVFTAGSVAEAEKGAFRSAEHRTEAFDDLSEDMKETVAGLKEGETTQPFAAGKEFAAIRLDRIEPSSSPSSPVDRETVRRQLTEAKKEKIISDWVANLRKRASIEIPLGVQKQGKP